MDKLPGKATGGEPGDALEPRFWTTIDRIRDRNAELDPEKEHAFITDIVENVRQERHDAVKHKASGSH